MNLLLCLLLVFAYLFIIDVRLAFIRLFFPRSKRDAAIHHQAILGSRWILYWGRKLIGLHIHVEPGASQLPRQFVLVANHQSLLDIMVILANFPDHQVRFVAKRELGSFIPGASRVLRYGGHALINRHDNLRETTRVLKNFGKQSGPRGWCPVIFPEGTRSRDGVLKEFQQGAYRFVQEPLMLPTVVTCLDGGWKYSHVTDFFRPNHYKYRIKVVDVLPAPETKKHIKDQLEASHRLISQQLDEWHRT